MLRILKTNQPQEMRTIIFSILILFSINISYAESISREEFDQSVKGSFSSEDGYYGTKSGDKVKFTKYICEHWATLLDEYTPNTHNTGNYKTLTLSIICHAAEELPPMEYLNFLDKLLDMEEQGKLPSGGDSMLLHGSNEKHDFLSVNWEHPRVQKILAKAIKVFSNNRSSVELLKSMAAGELADNYREGVSDDMPDPQTLPGIKLKRPFGSLIRKIELFTGKKVPPDPKYDPRPTRRGGSSADTTATLEEKAPSIFHIWPWLALGIAVLAFASFIWKKRGNRNSGLS